MSLAVAVLGVSRRQGPDSITAFYWKALEAVSESKTWMCLICGWIYDEASGDPEHGIAPGTPWAAVPVNWTCPECGGRKEDFEMVQL
jgi:rubredoxin